MARLIATIGLTAFLLTNPGYAADGATPGPTCLRLELEVQRNRANIEGNQFNIATTLAYFNNFFGQAFRRQLQDLRAGQVWVDFGAGLASPQLTYLKRFAGRPGEGVTAIAVGVTRPPGVPETAPGFRYLSGKYVEAPDAVYPVADLATDFVGPFSYSTRPDLVLTKYLHGLRNGDSTLFLKAVGGQTQVKLRNGTVVPIEAWLLRIGDIKVTRANFGESMLIQKLTREPKIPKLRMIEFSSDKPPVRMFEEISE